MEARKNNNYNKNIIDLRVIHQKKQRKMPNVLDLKNKNAIQKKEKLIKKTAKKKIKHARKEAVKAVLQNNIAPKENFDAPIRPIVEEKAYEPITSMLKGDVSEPKFIYNFDGRKRKLLETPKEMVHKKFLLISLLALSSIILFSLILLWSYREVISFKNSMMSEASSGVSYMFKGEEEAKLGNFSIAKNDFVEANKQFSDIQGKTIFIAPLVASIGNIKSPLREYATLLNVLYQGSQGGIDAMDIAQNVSSLKSALDQVFTGGKNIPIVDSVNAIKNSLDNLNSLLASINSEVAAISPSYLPSQYQSQFARFKSQLAGYSGSSSIFSDMSFFLGLLDTKDVKNYLFVFENPSELRPTGGFMGTYGVLSMQEGEVKSFSMDGIYNPDGQMSKKIIPPFPLQDVTYSWEMHDANWFPDFPTSAQKIEMMYQYDGGPSTDGVIAVNADLIKNLLSIAGPIYMPQYNLTISSDNFYQTIQYQVEVAYNKQTNKPKEILNDLMPLLFKKLFSEPVSSYPQLAKAIVEAMKEKQILFYFNNSASEKYVLNNGWGGEIKSTGGDYLYVVDTNIDGYKTDLLTKENISYKAQITSSTAAKDTVSIQRTNTGGNSQYDYYNKPNIDFMRVYVPLGSKLTGASGFTMVAPKFASFDYKGKGFQPDPTVLGVENTMTFDPSDNVYTFTESGKTVFAGWVITNPGATTNVVLSYNLPESSVSESNFSVLMQKEPGKTASLNVQLQVPSNFSITSADNKPLNTSFVSFSDTLYTDKLYKFGIIGYNR